MIHILIPGVGEKQISHVVFDYNGTIAQNGILIPGVKEEITEFSNKLCFHVITADTFGFVKKELSGVNCSITIIPEEDQAESKLEFVRQLGPDQTLCAGNGANDRLMLKEAAIGIAVLQDEGLAISSLLASDLVVKNILDVFGFCRTPDRLKATLRK